MKIISFSLWGDDKLYCQGAIDNVYYAKKYYPNWICRFYVARDCPALPILKLMNCQVIEMPSANGINRDQDKWVDNPNYIAMLWRFLAIDDPNVDRVIFRDTDSRVSLREAQAVKEWENSRLTAHRMHECKAHWNAQMMGGMWGIIGKRVSPIEEKMEDYTINFYKPYRKQPWIFVDLWFIMDVIWPLIENDCIGHGYGHPNRFIVEGDPVGSVVNENWRGQKYV